MAAADEAAPIKYIAPYAGCAMAEYFLYSGRRRSWSTTTSPSTRRPTARCRCCCAVRLAARRIRATSSTCTRGCSSAPSSCRRHRRPGHRREAARRRLADRAADHRDPGGRRLGVHPDERDLDHRRPDLPPGRAVPLGSQAGDQRRDLGLPGRRKRADHADAEGRGAAEARPLAVPRARGVLPVRLRARRRDAADLGPWRTARADAQPGRAPAAADRGSGGPDLRGHERLPRPDHGRQGRAFPR